MKELIQKLSETCDKDTAANAYGAKRIRLLGNVSSQFLNTIAKRCKALGLDFLYSDHAWPGDSTIIDVETIGVPAVLQQEDDVDNVRFPGMSAVSEAIYNVLCAQGVSGRHVVIVGRGHAVKGLAEALLRDNATVTICHSKTRYLFDATTTGDVLVVAVPTTSKPNVCTYNKSLIIDVGNALDRDEIDAEYISGSDLGRLTISILLNRCV